MLATNPGNNGGRPQVQELAGIQLDQHGLSNLKTSLCGACHAFDSPNTELPTSVRLFIGLTGAFILRRFHCVYSSLRPLSGLARLIRFAKLKNLANQWKESETKS